MQIIFIDKISLIEVFFHISYISNGFLDQMIPEKSFPNVDGITYFLIK